MNVGVVRWTPHLVVSSSSTGTPLVPQATSALLSPISRFPLQLLSPTLPPSPPPVGHNWSARNTGVSSTTPLPWAPPSELRYHLKFLHFWDPSLCSDLKLDALILFLGSSLCSGMKLFSFELQFAPVFQCMSIWWINLLGSCFDVLQFSLKFEMWIFQLFFKPVAAAADSLCVVSSTSHQGDGHASSRRSVRFLGPQVCSACSSEPWVSVEIPFCFIIFLGSGMETTNPKI